MTGGAARMLDESLDILAAAWSGQPVHHHGRALHGGRHPVPAPPGAAARRTGVGRRVPGQRQAAAPGRPLQGFFPVNLDHADQLAEAVAAIAGLRPPLAAPYDIAVGLPPGSDPAPYAAAGATWWLPEFDPATVSLDQVRGVLRDGPAAL